MLQEIISAEMEIKSALEDAKKHAEQRVSDAEKAAEQEVSSFEAALADSMASALLGTEKDAFLQKEAIIADARSQAFALTSVGDELLRKIAVKYIKSILPKT